MDLSWPEVARKILDGELDSDAISGYLRLISASGESVAQLVAFVREMRSRMIPVSLNASAIDVCGTGGTGRSRFNVSTAVSFLVAAVGVGVAKHGNRGSHSSNGSFDFLDALGIPYDFSPTDVENVFDQFRLCFLFARAYHPYLAPLAPIRAAIGARTIFNLAGPLCNPAGVAYQIIGTPSIKMAGMLAEAVAELGITRAAVVANSEMRDECVPGSNLIFEVRDGKTAAFEYDFSIHGVQSIAAIDWPSTAEGNAALFIALMEERTLSPLADWISINAALALWIYGQVPTISAGLSLAREGITSGCLADFFYRYRDFTQSLRARMSR